MALYVCLGAYGHSRILELLKAGSIQNFNHTISALILNLIMIMFYGEATFY